MRDDTFEWDDQKAARNFAKHNVSFAVARGVFNDLASVGWEDDAHGDFERRFVEVGIVEGRLLSVCYTIRGQRTRIISARLAGSWERRMYFDGR